MLVSPRLKKVSKLFFFKSSDIFPFQSENVEFDPVMMVKCMADIAKLCSKVTFGQAKVNLKIQW